LGGAWDFNANGSLAAAVKNLGSAPAGYALPRTFGLGGAYRWFSRRLLVSAELEAPLSKNTFNLGLGAEFLPWKWLAVRAGYKGPLNKSDLENLTLGLGANFWNFNLDLAVTSRGDLGTQGTLSLSYAFSKPAPAVEKTEPAAKPPVAEKGKNAENFKYQGEDKNQAEFHFHAGKEYERYGQLIDAIVEYKAALNIKPDYTEAQKALAAAREKARIQNEGQKEAEKEAKNETSESLQLTIRKYYEQGMAAYKNHDYSNAIRQLQLVLELTTQHRQATELLGKAKDALNRELGALRSQAQQAKARGDLAQEIDACRKMLELDPENKAVKAEMAAAEKKVPGTVDALYKKGVDQYAAGELRAALRTFQTLLQLQPDHVKAKDAEANIKEKLLKTGQ
jgi:tetratricopeptide (TPR) repeat protein